MQRNLVLTLMFVCIQMVVLTLQAQVAPSDEAAIRRAYGRLAFATEINAVEESNAATAAQLKSDIAGKAVQFQITGVTGGPISQIANLPFTSFAHDLHRDVIQVGFATRAGRAKMSEPPFFEDTAKAEWVEGYPDDGQDVFPESFKVKDAMAGQFPSADRYVQVSLSVTLAGRSRAYQSIFFFDSKGVKFLNDPIVGFTALFKFMTQPVYPVYLLKGLPQAVAARQWLKDKVLAGCSDADPKECCDFTACGIHVSDIPAEAKLSKLRKVFCNLCA